MSTISSEDKKLHTIAFYNLENLFDTKNDPLTFDDSFTPSSEKKWTQKKYQKKLNNLGQVIALIGLEETKNVPTLLGVAEIENALVLKDLINTEHLKQAEYDFVHFDSQDERGIDTGLLYRKDCFRVLEKKAIKVHLTNDKGEQDFTRDILYVKGKLENEDMHVLVNHWPSRRAGTKETEHKRITVALKNREIINTIRSEEPGAKIIVLGDFNDDPHCKSIQELVNTDMYNPMELLLTKYKGSLKYKGQWILFDQIILSNNFLQQHGNSFRFEKASIFNSEILEEKLEKYKGNPFRTFVGKKYLGGYSDHFPVYGIFSINR